MKIYSYFEKRYLIGGVFSVKQKISVESRLDVPEIKPHLFMGEWDWRDSFIDFLFCCSLEYGLSCCSGKFPCLQRQIFGRQRNHSEIASLFLFSTWGSSSLNNKIERLNQKVTLHEEKGFNYSYKTFMSCSFFCEQSDIFGSS